jgi:aspartyl-tRNA(Asn)/glutamyl-tRNA(Gln) amidotransferase subunit B
MNVLNEKNMPIDKFSKIISPEELGKLVNMIESSEISNNIAKMVFEEKFKPPIFDINKMTESVLNEAIRDESIIDIIKKKGFKQIVDQGSIEKIIDDILNANTAEVAAYRAGKTKLLGFFVGQIMKKTGGQANPQLVNQILKQKLSG